MWVIVYDLNPENKSVIIGLSTHNSDIIQIYVKRSIKDASGQLLKALHTRRSQNAPILIHQSNRSRSRRPAKGIIPSL